MKQKIFFIFLGLILITGMTVVVYFGIQPRPIDKIKLSQFESPKKAAEAMLLRLRQELTSQSILFWGVDPRQGYHQQVWLEFIRLNQEGPLKYQQIIVDASLAYPVSEGMISFAVDQDPNRLVALLRQAHSEGTRSLVVLPHVQASQKIEGSISQVIVTQGQLPANSILFVKVPKSREEEVELSIPCHTAQEDQVSSGRLGCLILQKARSLYLKKMAGDHLGYLYQIGGSEYVFAFQ